MVNHTAGRPASVYKYFDANSLLLYVGMTGRGQQRQAEHNATKEWWKFVSHQEVEHFTRRADAETRERALIRLHRPPFNVAHNPDHADTRAAYLSLATKNGERVRNLSPAFIGRNDPKRISMDVRVLGNIVTLASRSESYDMVKNLDLNDLEDTVVGSTGAKGMKPKLIQSRRVGREGIELRVACRKHAHRCVGATIMVRMPDGKMRKRKTLKRVDLHASGDVVTS